MTIAEPDDYTNLVNTWILALVEQGITSFDQLIVSLPGVYPATVLISLRNLVLRGLISHEIIENMETYIRSGSALPKAKCHNIELPLPHPLDYDWRFHDSSVKLLLEKSSALSQQGDKFILLGTPSILRYALETAYPRKMFLIDSNCAVMESLAKMSPKYLVAQCDISKEDLPNMSSSVIIMDPPWYTESIQLFLWAASRLSSIGGHLLASFPPVGTRPNIKQEREKLFSWAKQLGFSLVQLQESALPYTSPPFERNALRTQGIYNISTKWRRGDLATFLHTNQVLVNRPIVSLHEGEWTEEVISGIRFRVRYAGDSEFVNPMLIPVLSENIFPSVSRRDERRKLISVWTSGNRVFKCEGKNTLRHVLNALATHTSPYQNLSRFLKRELSEVEKKLVSDTIRQIDDITILENHEMQFYREGS